jgi:hypothetical protein
MLSILQSTSPSFFAYPTIQQLAPSLPSLSSPQTQLINSTLSQALEHSLVDRFFLSAHTYTQAVHPTIFKAEYEAACCISSLLPPAAQCVVALMAAHGARLSDSPHQVQLEEVAKDERERGGREAMSQALAKRGLDMMERYELLTRPSRHAVAALVLGRSLLHEYLDAEEDRAYSVRRLSFSSVASICIDLGVN